MILYEDWLIPNGGALTQGRWALETSCVTGMFMDCTGNYFFISPCR